MEQNLQSHTFESIADGDSGKEVERREFSVGTTVVVGGNTVPMELAPVSEQTRANISEKASTTVQRLSAPEVLVGSREMDEVMQSIKDVGVAAMSKVASVDSPLLQVETRISGMEEAGKKVEGDLVNLQKSLDSTQGAGMLKGLMLRLAPKRVEERAINRLYTKADIIKNAYAMLDENKRDIITGSAQLRSLRQDTQDMMKELRDELYYLWELDEHLVAKVAELAEEDRANAEEQYKKKYEEALAKTRRRYNQLSGFILSNFQLLGGIEITLRNAEYLVDDLDNARTTGMTLVKSGEILESALRAQKNARKTTDSMNEWIKTRAAANADTMLQNAQDTERAAMDSGLDIEGFKRNWEKNMQALEVVQRTRANMVEQGRRDKEAVTNILNDAARAIANSDNQETFAIER